METFQLIGGLAGLVALAGLFFQARQIKDARKVARAHLAGTWKLFRLHDGVTLTLRLTATNNGSTAATDLATRTWLEGGTERIDFRENRQALGYLPAHGGKWHLVVPLDERSWELFNQGEALFHSEVHFKDEFGEWWVWEVAVRQNDLIDPSDVETVDGPRIRKDDDPPPWPHEDQ